MIIDELFEKLKDPSNKIDENELCESLEDLVNNKKDYYIRIELFPKFKIMHIHNNKTNEQIGIIKIGKSEYFEFGYYKES